MTKLLIITRKDDSHAAAVKNALEAQHHQVDLWHTADFPSKHTYSSTITNQQISSLIRDQNWQAAQDYDVIWNRRPAKPVLPDYLHPDDIDNATKENAAFMHNIWQTIYPSARWINPVNAASQANSKLLQLKLANDAGITIPDTLISNDPSLIRNWVKNRNVVYKTLHPMTWIKQDEIRLMYTRKVSLTDLPHDQLLQCVPGIYQSLVEKEHELRITYFGERYIAVKINSQQIDSAKMDWRAAPTKQLTLEQVELPEAIDDACRTIMQKLGIVFGCFDFIVTPDNDYYFLEVNEQGQFLWIEEVNPSIKLLQPFCEFITNP